jgi:sec-independent protein translocase protein TatC
MSMPVVIHEIGAFIGPALYPHERKSILRLLLPSAILLTLGSAFTYLLVTPVALQFLYTYGISLGAETFITLNDLMSFVIIFTLAGGISFQLPIAMWLVTTMRAVDAAFWRRNASYAIVAIVIFGAILTPDGSGITMWLVAGPMIVLYSVTYLLLRREDQSFSGGHRKQAA